MASSTRCAATTSPMPTRTPCARKRSASTYRPPSGGGPTVGTDTTVGVDRSSASGATGPASPLRPVVEGSRTGEHSLRAHALEILADLQRDAKRRLQVVGLQRQQRPRPRDRLPHTGQLVQL